MGSMLLRSQWLEYVIREPAARDERISGGVFSAMGFEISILSWERGGIRSVVAVI
jgi:hypothetical protein